MSRRLRTRKPRSALLRSVGVCSLLLCGRTAAAQETSFNVETFEPGPATSSVLGVEATNVPAHLKTTADAVLHRSESPVVFRRDEVVEAIDDRWTLDLGLGLGLFRDFQIDARLPLVTTQSGVGIRDQLTGLAAGDLRLRGKWRLLERDLDNPFGLALQAAFYLPTGDQGGFASDGTLRVEPRLVADATWGPLTFAANVGYQIRGERLVGAFRHDDVLRWGAAARLGLGAGFDVEGSVFGEHSLLPVNIGGESTSNRFGHPVEALGGFGWSIGDFRASLAGGTGLSRGVGAPAYRVVFGIGYEPFRDPQRQLAGRTVQAHDFDADGFAGDADLCPYDAETFDGFQDLDGCPDLDDDGDRVADIDDLCPLDPGIAAKSGCPLADADADGIDDAQDACPVIAGPPDGDGCPQPRESDQWRGQFAAVRAACDITSAACATIDVEEELPDAVFFPTGRDQFRPVENPLVERVAERMRNDPSIVKLVIEGHTDSVGEAEFNRTLSENRAQTVLEAIAAHGVALERLEVHPYGEERPLDSNDTDEGRARNRRVAFRMTMRQRDREVEISDVPSEVEVPTLSLADFAFERRSLVGVEPARFVEGTELTAPDGWLCSDGDEAPARTLLLLTTGAPIVGGLRYPGWSSEHTLVCRRGTDLAKLPLVVEIPPFTVRSAADGVQLTTRRPTKFDVRFAGRALPLEVQTDGYVVEKVGVSADILRLRLRDGATDTGAVRLGVANRTLLNVPLLAADDAVYIEPAPQQRRWIEIGGGTSIIAAGSALALPGQRGSTAIFGLRVTARSLSTNWFSVGAILDIGSTLGRDPIEFTPGIGGEAVFHLPFQLVRPFISTGIQAWFPGIVETRPAWESAVGLDWEPAAGVGLRGSARAVVLTNEGDLEVLPGAFLGAFTTF